MGAIDNHDRLWHAIASALDQARKRRFAIGPVQGERRILRRLEPQTLRTEARASAIKMPHAEKREIQWKRNGRNE